MTRLRVPTQPRRAALRLCTALAAPALMLAALPAAHAQTVDLDEVVISALRTEAGIRATGVSVGVIDRAAIEADGRTSLAEILADQPGLTAASSGPFGSTNTVRIRGAGKPYVAVFIDGIRVDDPSEPQAGFDFGALMASDIGRVEILRGSQSALWGSAAVGGVISITTLGAIEEGLNQQVQVEAGSHRTVRLGYGLTQKTGALEMALNLSRLRTDGFSAAAAGKEKDGADAMRLSFSARPPRACR